VTRTHSRPHVSDDNPYSGAQFKTLKCHPTFPERFGSAQDARSFCQTFFPWYNTEHRHDALGLLTPEMVHYGRTAAVVAQRRTVLAAAYAAHPERFVRRPPEPLEPPTAAWINPPAPPAFTGLFSEVIASLIRSRVALACLAAARHPRIQKSTPIDLRDRPAYHPAMDRRRFLLTGLAGGLAAPLRGEAQPANKVPRIGVLWGGPAEFARPYLEGGRRAARDLGYVEERDFAVEYAFGERKPGAVDVLAPGLVQRKVDVIVAAGDPAIYAARRATSAIPIVMVAAGDPVGGGLVASLARPGGNITGMTFLSTELAAKRLEILKEIVPTVSRVSVLWNPDNPGGTRKFGAIQTAARIMRLTLQSLEVRTATDIEQAFGSMADKQVQAVLVVTDPVTAAYSGRPIADLATKSRLPVVGELREFTNTGSLVSYGPSLQSMVQHVVIFIDKILKGARPAETPRRAAHAVRACDQLENGEDPRPYDPAVTAAAGGPGHRVMDRRTWRF
jgi:putative ABC transport system substrate-binding protein